MALLRIERGDLAGLDGLGVEALAVFSWRRRGQPQDVAGMIDWRLAGRLARLSRDGRFAGDDDESLLMPTQGRLPAQRIFWFGLGDKRDPAQVKFDEPVRRLFEAGATRLGVVAPDGEPEETVELLVRFVEAAQDRFHELTLLETDDRVSSGEDKLKAAAKAAKLSFGA